MPTRTTISIASSLLCVSALLSLAPRVARACGGGDEDIDEETFFMPRVIDRPEDEPLFFDPYNRFHVSAAKLPGIEDVNLQEWDGFFGHAIPKDAWARVLNKAPLDEIDRLIFVLQGKAGASARPEDDAFLKYKDRAGLIAALYYVGFAKRVEPLTAPVDAWTAPPAADPKLAAELSSGGEKAMARTRLAFLRQRYAFQLVRLKFFAHDYPGTVSLAQKLEPDLGDASPGWRARAYAAGARYKQKQFAEANALYGRVFDRFAPLRAQVLWSFHPQSEKDWAATLTLAHTPHEKAALWALFGMYADGPRALAEIRALEPGSKLLPLLVVREVVRAELEDRSAVAPGKPLPVHLTRLMKVVEDGSDRGDVNAPQVWDLAAAHLRALAGDGAGAAPFLARVEKRGPMSAAVRDQLDETRFYAELQALRGIKPADQPLLTRELEAMQRRATRPGTAQLTAFATWARGRLGTLLSAGGEHLLAACLVADPAVFDDPKGMQQFMAFLDKPKKTPFEATLARVYGATSQDLQQPLALLLFRAGEYEQASKVLARIPAVALRADPFAVHIVDCIDCDRNQPPKMTLADLSSRLASDTLAMKARGPDAAKAAMELGSALYNVTVGNNRDLAGGRWHELRDVQVRNLERAQAAFEVATETTRDRELATRAAYGAAKAELVVYLARNPPGSTLETSALHVEGTWFHALRDRYADTAYYREVLKECGYFRRFVEKSKH